MTEQERELLSGLHADLGNWDDILGKWVFLMQVGVADKPTRKQVVIVRDGTPNGSKGRLVNPYEEDDGKRERTHHFVQVGAEETCRLVAVCNILPAVVNG